MFKKFNPQTVYDRWLLAAVIAIISLGLLMVSSASIVVSMQKFHQAFHFLTRQLVYLALGLVVSLCVIRIRAASWMRYGTALLFISLLLLILVLVPGIGREVNGSSRWIGLGPIGFQVSEVAKFCVILYLAGYLVRRSDEVKEHVIGFIKPMGLLGIVAFFLLLEPDFGAAVVIMSTALAMMFLAGVRVKHFVILVIFVGLALAVLAISSPYRLQRLTTFLNPWANQFNSGYQLTQSLIAFGRGGVFGVGLGNSVQKLFYLPEAHTDFLFAVLAEELGLVGAVSVILLYAVVVIRALFISRIAICRDAFFEAYVAAGFGLWLGLQAIINIGVNSGLLPTKGLTLPLMSYGGSSMVINCVLLAILFRIDYENRCHAMGIHPEHRRAAR